MLYRNTDGIPRETVMHVAHRLHGHGLRQAEIAQIFNCSQSTVSAWLKDVRQQPSHIDQAQVEAITRSLTEISP